MAVHSLWQALGICPGDVVALTGGGGKTSLAATLARELQAEGRPVIVTTTTKIFPAAAMDLVLSGGDDLRAVQAVLAQGRNVCVAARVEEGTGKLIGLAPERIAALRGLGAGAVLVEADGSAGRPLKAPAAHEPVIPACADLVVPVAGASAMGRNLTAEVAHRVDSVAAYAGVAVGQPITPDVVAAALLACTKGAPAGARVVPVIGQADLEGAEAVATEIAGLLINDGGRGQVDGDQAGGGCAAIGRVVAAAPGTPAPVRRVYGQVSALVLAGGASRRFGGAKLLHPWAGKTLVEASLMAPLRAAVREVVLVTGAFHQELVKILAPYPVRLVYNPDWAEGMSTSVRSGLATITAEVDVQGVLICLADQPLLPPLVPDALIAAFKRTQSTVIAAALGGARRNPVLFRRNLFAELAAVEGDEGGRSVVQRHRTQIRLVEFTNPDWFQDVDIPSDLPDR